MAELTRAERETIQWVVSELVETRVEVLEKLLEDYPEENLCERFQNEIGLHEIQDRAWVQYENWEQYVLRHPGVVLSPELYQTALLVNALMAEFYQMVGRQAYYRGRTNGTTIDPEAGTTGGGATEAADASE